MAALPLKPFAGVGVPHRRREAAEAEGQHDDLQHGLLLCAAIGEARRTAFRACRGLRCHPAHRFSRWELVQRYRNLISALARRTGGCSPWTASRYAERLYAA